MLALQLQDWQNYVLASGASREGRGLQHAQDVYNEGPSMALLRQAVGDWSPRPHVIKYIVKEGDINSVNVAHKQIGNALLTLSRWPRRFCMHCSGRSDA